MKKLIIILLAAFLPAMAMAGWDDAQYRQIEQTIRTPKFPDKAYVITKFGASPSKSAKQNQKAINQAIAKCSKAGGGRVIVPAGTYSTGAITLQSGVNLVVEEGATLLFAFEPELYPIVPTRWEGLDCWNLQPCIYAYGAKDVAITGRGTIDGGGTNDTWWKWCGSPRYGWTPGTISQRNGARARLLQMAEDGVDKDQRRFGPDDGLRPQLVNFYLCDGVLIEDVTLLRSPFWVIHPLMSKNVVVRGVHINNDGPNGDGCDPESCDGVLIENCYFNTGDDCIAVKSGRNNDGRLWDLPSQNIIVRGCMMQNGHGGVVIGSEISGGCRNLFAENCKMDSPNLDRVLRIKTNTCRGGVIENINLRNVEVGQCGESVLKINLDYEHNEICCRGFLPTVRNVNLENVTCGKSKYGVQIIALDTSVNVYDINVDNCRFSNVADGNNTTGLTRDINYVDYYVNGSLCLRNKPYAKYSEWMAVSHGQKAELQDIDADAIAQDTKVPEAAKASARACALMRAYRMGQAGSAQRDAGIKAFKDVVKNYVVVNPDSTLQLAGCEMIEPFIQASLEAEALGYDIHAIENPIDRQAVVTRNNPKVTKADPLAALSVGNGHFAATVDITGLQSYPAFYATDGIPLDIMSDWGWHSFENTDNFVHADTEREVNLHNRPSGYAIEYKTPGRSMDATSYFRVNPHRLALGTIGLELLNEDGKVIPIEDLTEVNQELALWDGMIYSRFCADGEDVEVSTGVLADKDCLFSRILTPLLAEGRARVTLRFSYPTGAHADDANDWNRPDCHTSSVVESGRNHAIIRRQLDDTTYYILLQWEGDATLQEADTHSLALMPKGSGPMTFSAQFSEEMSALPEVAYSYDQAIKAVMKQWPAFWRSGAFVDFGACTDPRAAELERRVILSQYLTKINCDGATPPQETGLTYNSWFGRPHLEMEWWHVVDFALWGRPATMQRHLDWYMQTALPLSRDIAKRQGFAGARWMKMTDPQGGEAPSNTGSFLTWQQPHFIYMAEELYRSNPSDEILARYAEGVDATAEFMADFAQACYSPQGDIRMHGATAMQESMSKDFSYHHPFEQAYWVYGLTTAQAWRERQGLPRNPQWDKVIADMAPLAMKDSIYTAGVSLLPLEGGKAAADFDPYTTPAIEGAKSISEEDFMLKCRSDHPAVLGACGLLPNAGTLYDEDTMRATLAWVMDNWNWPTTWGWDYGMIAMCAARLGQPETALQALLIDKGKNTYLVSGHNFQEPKRLRLYLPGNGALLDAIALMCAGWDGCSQPLNPGFPASWPVRWEGIQRLQ